MLLVTLDSEMTPSGWNIVVYPSEVVPNMWQTMSKTVGVLRIQSLLIIESIAVID